jgi:formate-dependent nitrite reductase cytochrome c552 subunit
MVFLSPRLSKNEQEQLKNYFNFILESFRNELDSEFLTTYKYSNASYTRKFLGLTQVRKLIETFPFNLSKDKRTKLAQIIAKKNIKDLMQFLLKLKS